MDALLAYIPDWINYWLVAFVVSLLLNVYQFAKTRDLSGTLDILFKHGHAPEGKALVPADSVKAAPPARPPPTQPAARRPWEK